MASQLFKIYVPNGRKFVTHIGLKCFSPELSESCSCKSELTNHEISVPSQKKRPTLTTNTCGENRKYYTPSVVLT